MPHNASRTSIRPIDSDAKHPCKDPGMQCGAYIPGIQDEINWKHTGAISLHQQACRRHIKSLIGSIGDQFYAIETQGAAYAEVDMQEGIPRLADVGSAF
jgi:hypothetical protein